MSSLPRVVMRRSKGAKKFDEAISTLTGISRGQESTMYGPLRDIFINVLGYPARSVHIDRSGTRGRPDITVMADGAVPKEPVSWIVLEAKESRTACGPEVKRAALFAEKSKYITADTAWFVMVDPTTLVARPADQGENAGRDIVLDLGTINIETFQEQLAPLRAEVAGVPHLLERFRAGDEDLIAVDKLSGDDTDAVARAVARNAFYDSLEETTRTLQQAAIGALRATRAARDALAERVDEFEAAFGHSTFTASPVSIEGRPASREQAIAHGRAAHALNGLLAGNPALARLTLSALPSFSARTGIDQKKQADQLEAFFATETANLILARILLIRFLEDQGFFDEVTPDKTVRRRYLCNGGVAAFQGMRDYFNTRYTRLLEDAYRSGAKVYAAAFRETEHDWVLDLADDTLSRTVEWAMFRFARFDFTTVRGDILTGIYDRFLDPSQRKAQGEFYTPPSIARYMLDRLHLAPGDGVFDPSCGSGTFLIERYQQAVGEDVDRGVATYADAHTVVENLAGNDLNPFSAVLTQIQLLWHLLVFGPEVRAFGFPAIRVSERANSLVPTDLRDQTTTRFGDIDVPGYAGVVGNPPYVRPERALELEKLAHDYYAGSRTDDYGRAHRGISVESNVYNLFIYRALDYWCAAPDEDTPAGRMAFVIPLNFCAAGSSADLRALFAPGGRWTITEIVDLELIWADIFDADVLPMILFAERRPPEEDEKTIVRHADPAHVLRASSDRKARPTFDLAATIENCVPYSDLFTPEGRIATRMTPERAVVARKLRALPPLSDAAKRLWVKRKGGYEVVDVEPKGFGAARWEEQRMIGDGVAKRSSRVTEGTPNGLDVYKGENIRTGGLVGDAQFRSLDVWNLSSPSFWKRPDLLPDRMWCMPVIEQVPCAAPFDPKQVAVTNTATVFGPRADLEAFPFDLLLTSRIYGWITLLSLRSSYLNKLRNHMYSTTIARLPWSEALVAISATLEARRTPFLNACRIRFEAAEALAQQAGRLALTPFKNVFKTVAAAGERLELSEAFSSGETFVLDIVPAEPADPPVIVLSEEGHALTLPSATLERYVRAGLALVDLAGDGEMSRTKLLDLPIPPDDATADHLEQLLASVDPVAAEGAVEDEVDAIDAVVGPALGLTYDEIKFIQDDMRNDPFLSRVRPRYPYFTPKLRGRRTALESGSRYGA